ncbi:J domain-containing protein [Rhizobium azibense]|uniref:J domain-containing protein n=1 Tax=Rhizobium azibense TaxID=1136135 RepID=A0A4R3RHA9_9HYPH|nr:J domain-containing protein [Rhizobium azibense]TCU34034.1 hypothetical protein EV129_11317 [Rhizobium azibense]
MTSAFPLKWPTNRPRKQASQRKRAKFNREAHNGRYAEKKSLSVADALSRLQSEIDAVGGRYPVISSNVELRLDGLPRSGQREQDDPGVCLYFDLKGKPMALPCDTYDRVADNIAAIAAHMEATRKIERHGVATVSEMFAGFEALPAPAAARNRTWRQVLEIGTSGPVLAENVEAAFRHLAKKAHPDAGGSHETMSELNRAREEAMKELGV